MNRVISVLDGSLLYGMLAEMAGDIILKTDALGFVQSASPGLDALGTNLSEMLISPHLADLAVPGDREAICCYVDEVLTGISSIENLEFSVPATADGFEQNWYSMTLRPSPNDQGRIVGLVGVLRKIEPAHLREEQLIVAAMTDSLTGLPNRRAFMTSASQLLERGPGGALALLELDDFRSIAFRFGQVSTDEVVMAFAQFLSVMMVPGQSVARMEGGRFAMLLPDAQQHEAHAMVDEIVTTFARVTTGTGQNAGVIKASAGVASISGSLDGILAKAERALVMARIGGGSRAELGDRSLRYVAGSSHH
ncbi:MAG: diguanylate cyclase [Erythrobacter sp.]|uniref:GGDEF domain-containing protein n=1 Tax=Parasphingorhabdus sp. TaxID=2709688 RepID=UPI003297071B